MNDIERIQAVLTTLLEAAQVGAVSSRMDDDLFYGQISDDLMKRIVIQDDDAIGLIARRLVDVANHE